MIRNSTAWDICVRFQEQVRNDPCYLTKVLITCDNGCIYGYKQQSSQWKDSPKKVCQADADFFSDTEDIVHKKFVPPNMTINAEF